MAITATAAVPDNTIVITKRDGNAYAVNTDDIDSIRFCLPTDVPQHLYLCRDTIYECVTAADNWYINLENPIVTDYLNNTDYSQYLGSEEAYKATTLGAYLDLPHDYRTDQPRGVRLTWTDEGINQWVYLSRTPDFSVIDDSIAVDNGMTACTAYNLIPGQKYYYRVTSLGTITKESHFWTTGQLRMMCLPSIDNVRDIGGWPTADGHRLRYGLIYRGSEMVNSKTLQPPFDHTLSSADSIFIHDNMDIRLDMDLRDHNELDLYDTDPSNDRNYTPLGDDVIYKNEMVNYNYPYFQVFGYNYNFRFGRTIVNVINTLVSGHSAYIHCTWGADRTGIVSMIIEGLLGVSEADLSKDYELTSFSHDGHCVRSRGNDYWYLDINLIKSQTGDTLRDKFETFCKRIGVTEQNIADLRRIMLE